MVSGCIDPRFLDLGTSWRLVVSCKAGRFTPVEKAPGTYWIGGWVGPRVGLDDVEKRKFFTLPELELRPLGRPARTQSLYRLRYPVSHLSQFLRKTISDLLPVEGLSHDSFQN
jgi:hypothetical protein